MRCKKTANDVWQQGWMPTSPSHCKRRSSSSLLTVSFLAPCPCQKRHVPVHQTEPSLTGKQLSHVSKGIERCSRKLCGCSSRKRERCWLGAREGRGRVMGELWNARRIP